MLVDQEAVRPCTPHVANVELLQQIEDTLVHGPGIAPVSHFAGLFIWLFHLHPVPNCDVSDPGAAFATDNSLS